MLFAEIGLLPEMFPEKPDIPETAMDTLLLLDASLESNALRLQLLWFVPDKFEVFCQPIYYAGATNYCRPLAPTIRPLFALLLTEVLE